ncbi:Vasoactive intestinal polypeptide receptor 1 [Liparis tanakae]|uniref:Vasoactive intestinal polypeptide receptor 1 n=1 Tax=Liparis tanakae TaxID=230148 RepID=A0A4Z2GFK9_9TELE|nr:Vasoactive intestinal polypeptide receptor 1 [Liparis tanakae]
MAKIRAEAIHPDCAIISQHLRAREVCRQTTRSEAQNQSLHGALWALNKRSDSAHHSGLEEMKAADFYASLHPPTACKSAVAFFQFSILANYFWLLVEGMYLQTLLALTFVSQRKYFWWYILIGWGLPSTVLILWVLIRFFYDDKGCWDDTDNVAIWWIIKGPITASLLINIVIFINVIRILVQKLQSSTMANDTGHFMRLAKSTLFLIPLFGMHYTVFAFLPENTGVAARLYIELGMGSFQGFVVALLYCFMNGESMLFTYMYSTAGPNRAAEMAVEVSQSKPSHAGEAKHHSDNLRSPRGPQATSFQRKHLFSLIFQRPAMRDKLWRERQANDERPVPNLLMTITQQPLCGRSLMNTAKYRFTVQLRHFLLISDCTFREKLHKVIFYCTLSCTSSTISSLRWKPDVEAYLEGSQSQFKDQPLPLADIFSVQHTVLDEDGDGSQDEGHKQVHVDEVPGAVELPAEERGRHAEAVKADGSAR